MIRALRQEAGKPTNPIHIVLPVDKVDRSVPTLCGRTFETITRTWEAAAATASCPDCLERLTSGQAT